MKGVANIRMVGITKYLFWSSKMILHISILLFGYLLRVFLSSRLYWLWYSFIAIFWSSLILGITVYYIVCSVSLDIWYLLHYSMVNYIDYITIDIFKPIFIINIPWCYKMNYLIQGNLFLGIYILSWVFT